MRRGDGRVTYSDTSIPDFTACAVTRARAPLLWNELVPADTAPASALTRLDRDAVRHFSNIALESCGRRERENPRRPRLTILASGPDCLNSLQFLALHQVAATQPGHQFVPIVQAVEEEHEAHHIDDRKQCVLASHVEAPRG